MVRPRLVFNLVSVLDIMALNYSMLIVRKNISKCVMLAGTVTIIASLFGCSHTKALSKLERLILEDDVDVHCKSKAICCIEGIDYEKNHEEFTNIIFNSGNLHLINELVESFPYDYRNYIIKGDAYLKNAMMQQMVGLFMKSSAEASFSTAKESYMRAVELNSKDIYARGILSFMYGEENAYDKADVLLSEGLDIAPNNPLLYLAMGQMYDRKKEYAIAIDYYERILKFNGDEVEKDFEHMNQYYHKLMNCYPNSLAKAKEVAKKYLKKNYKRVRRKT